MKFKREGPREVRREKGEESQKQKDKEVYFVMLH